jgi:uncharacterized membrane protein YhaH (DUF805 family)
MRSCAEKNRAMLGFIFGLNARLGRLQYFLSIIGLAVVMTGICFLMARESFDAAANGIPLSIELIKRPAIIVGIIFLLITLTLQAMRFRDIGWDPVCVIPGWFAVLIVDMVVAKKFSGLSLGPEFPGLSFGPDHHGTAVGALVNVALLLALFFWPSVHDEDSMPTLDEPRRSDPSPRSSGTASVAAERIARASGDFGRRAL